MLYPSSLDHLLVLLSALFSALIAQCVARAPSARTLSSLSTNQYKDYRLYSVRMPDNYDLVRPANDEWSPNDSVSNDSAFNDSASNESTSSSREPTDASREQSSNNLFYSLMNELIRHVPIDVWQMQLNHSLFTVSPDYYVQVEDYLLNNSLSFDVLDANIQDRLNSEWQDVSQADDSIFNANLLLNSSFKLDTYHPLDEINDYLRYLAKRYPDTVRTNSIGKTFENRDILAITIRKKSNLKRPNVVIDAGIHPREWITQSSALILITKLVYYFNLNATHSLLDLMAFSHNRTEADQLEAVDWTIIPVLNPDGYVYTWLQDRLYRKNRAVPITSPRRAPWNFFKECVGVDLNRNFEYYFANSAQSSNPCNDVFPGDAAFSERESTALRTLIFTVRPDAYLSLHSFAQLITFPNKINRGKLPNHDQLKDVSRRMSLAMGELEGRVYRYGQRSQFSYGSTGDSVSWASLNGVNLTFRIDLRDKGAQGYSIARSQIIPQGEELMSALLVISNELQRSS